VTFPSE